MNKDTIVDNLYKANRTLLLKKEVRVIVDGVFAEIEKAAARGEKTVVQGFGVFKPATRKARTGQDYFGGTGAVKIPETRVLKLENAPGLRQILNPKRKIKE